MRLAKIRLHAPSPSLKQSIITDATHEIELDMAGIIIARPRVGGRALLYSDFAEAETLEEFPVLFEPQSIPSTPEETRIDDTIPSPPAPESIPKPFDPIRAVIENAAKVFADKPPRSEQVTLSERDIEEAINTCIPPITLPVRESIDSATIRLSPSEYTPPPAKPNDYKFLKSGGNGGGGKNKNKSHKR